VPFELTEIFIEISIRNIIDCNGSSQLEGCWAGNFPFSSTHVRRAESLSDTLYGMVSLNIDPSNSPEQWVREHLEDLCSQFEDWMPSSRFRGGQTAANEALLAFSSAQYAARRNNVLPDHRRGASALSPYIRHGLIQLPAIWDHVADDPETDRNKFRDELLWQEYSRHLYARIGTSLAEPLRMKPPVQDVPGGWLDRGDMSCIDFALTELETDGWLPNQVRMWLASHWTIRNGADWRIGERQMFRDLLDGSYANRAGWQWTIGSATGRPYGFSRWQVNKRASELCSQCPSQQNCPIEQWPDDPVLEPAVPQLSLRKGDHPPSEPLTPVIDPHRTPEAVWLTAESLGDDDPALRSHPNLPAWFVFDLPLLTKLQLHPRRLVFIAECLHDLARRREVRISIGDPSEVLQSETVAVTAAPVPGFPDRATRVKPAAIYPWPWLVPISDAPLSSFSAWRKRSKR